MPTSGATPPCWTWTCTPLTAGARVLAEPGAFAEFYVNAYPGKIFRARVHSVTQSTGEAQGALFGGVPQSVGLFVEQNNGLQLQFLPWADGVFDAANTQGSDFEVMERGICLGIRGCSGIGAAAPSVLCDTLIPTVEVNRLGREDIQTAAVDQRELLRERRRRRPSIQWERNWNNDRR